MEDTPVDMAKRICCLNVRVIDAMFLMIREEWNLPDGIITVLPAPWTK
jgi:hypothetical protein